MSRSRRHTPIFGMAGRSEKEDKRILHGKLRTLLRTAVKKMLLDESSEWYIVPHYDEVHNVWCMAKDGKGWWMDKGDDYYVKAMRK